MTTQEEDDNATHPQPPGDQAGGSCCQKLPNHRSLMTRAMMHHVANSNLGIRNIPGLTSGDQEALCLSLIDSAVTHHDQEPFCPLRALESLRREERDSSSFTLDANGDAHSAGDDDLEDSIDVHRRQFDSIRRSSNQQMLRRNHPTTRPSSGQ